MPTPIAVCLEDLTRPQEDDRFLKCVALGGRGPGLRISSTGDVRWKEEQGGAVACELWVSADERLILFRPEGAVRVAVHRAGRSLAVPEGKPVVVVHGDIVDGTDAGWARKVHVHGRASAVSAPSTFRRGVAKAVAAAAMSAAVVATSCGGATETSPDPVEIRDEPPSMTEVPPPDESQPEETPPPQEETQPPPDPDPEPIEVREEPPEPPLPDK